MKTLTTEQIFPNNKKHYLKLLIYLKSTLELLKSLKIRPIIYGSFAVFIYTKDKTININDIDILINEKHFEKLITNLKYKKINHKYNEKYHTIQLLKNNLKIELDSINFWQSNLPKKYKKVKLNDLNLTILPLNSLKLVYKQASKISDNKKENKLKFDKLNKIY